MTKKSIIISIIVLVVLIVLAIILGTGSGKETTPTAEQSVVNDAPQAIADDLSGLEITDVDKEFQDIDKQIQGL